VSDPGRTPILKVDDLVHYFDVSLPPLKRLLEGKPRVYLKAVDDFGFQIHRGETFALVGESGCGKSTVARLIVRLFKPLAGVIEFEGRDIARIADRRALHPFRRKVQMIFQDPYASLNPRMRVRDIIGEPIKAFHLLESGESLEDRVGELLIQVGLSPSDGEKYPHEFSGGQRQRISIARALASKPDFLICDEPTSALDVSIQAQILNLMKRLQRELGLTYLFISHDLAVVCHMADHVGVMYLGRLCEVAPADVLFSRPRHPYTRLLLDALPDMENIGRERTAIAGEVPNPIDPPTGCAFHPRCPFVDDRCRKETPVAKTSESGQIACHAVEEGRMPGDRVGSEAFSHSKE
jgi:peptide/nickel transport system ATP-binding protein